MLGEKSANERRKSKNYSSKWISYGINYQADPEGLEFTERKIVEIEDWSQKNNLDIDGLTEKENENWDEWEQEVQSLIKCKLGIAENIVLERAHQIKKGNSENP